MSLLRGCTFALLVMVAFVSGWAGRPCLHWHGGDVFGVFEADLRAPTRIECGATTAERFRCFAARARERVGDTSGALAGIAADGVLLETTTTEPGQAAPTTA